jgi:hypothetical protein
MASRSSYSVGGSTVKLVPNKRGEAELVEDLTIGLHALALAGELEAKREAPVRGGYRSFRPGTSPIGGTLRRSIHAVTYRKDGSVLLVDNESGLDLPPDYVPVPGHVVAYVGTNSGYGGYVELGTSKMPARAFIAPGLDASMQRAVAIIRDAVSRVRGRGR